MSSLLRRLGRQLPQVMAPTTLLFARMQVPAGLHVLAGGKVLGHNPSASAVQLISYQTPAGLHVLAGGSKVLGNPSSSAGQLIGIRVRKERSVGAQLMMNRACNTNSDNDYAKLVKKLAEAVEKNKLDTRYFHSIVIILLGALVAATGALTMKINKTDQENSVINAELEKHKIKADKLSKDVEFLTALSATDASVAKNESDASVPTSTPSATSGSATNGSPTSIASA